MCVSSNNRMWLTSIGLDAASLQAQVQCVLNVLLAGGFGEYDVRNRTVEHNLEASVCRHASESAYELSRDILLYCCIVEHTAPSPQTRAVVARLSEVVVRWGALVT